jgi:hypothetical protein
MFVAPYDATIDKQLTYILFASLSSVHQVPLGARTEGIAARRVLRCIPMFRFRISAAPAAGQKHE